MSPQPSHDHRVHGATQTAARLHVLLVEDDDADAELTEHMLGFSDGLTLFATARVGTVRQALMQLASTDATFDAVLLDLGLPDAVELSGLERLLSAHPNLAIVVMTGSGEGRIGPRAVASGAQDYLVKGQVTSAVLAKSLRFATERVRALNLEKQLLEKTLLGTIRVLTTVLSLVNPVAFGRAERLKEYVGAPARALGMAHQWTVEVAALVAQLGWVQGIPEECGPQASLTPVPGRRLLDDMPALAAELLQNIPHLEAVREILTLQADKTALRPIADPTRYADHVLLGAELLFIAMQFDTLENELGSKPDALRALREQKARYQPDVFSAFVRAQSDVIASSMRRSVPLATLIPGMKLCEDIRTPDGRLIVARGYEVTPTMLVRLRYFAQRDQISEPIHVQMRLDPSAHQGGETLRATG